MATESSPLPTVLLSASLTQDYSSDFKNKAKYRKQESHQLENYGPAITISIIIINYSSPLSTQGPTPSRGRLDWQYCTWDSARPLEAHGLIRETQASSR